jgi:hypothetical protein
MVRTDPDAISAVERERNVKMICALLFLILFAILFPKALRFLFALLFIGGIVLLGEVHAANYPYCHGDKTCNNEYKISMATCFSLLAVQGFNAADPRYGKVCRYLTEAKLKEMPTINKAPPIDCSGPIMKLPPGCEAEYQNDAVKDDVGKLSCQTIINKGWANMPDVTDYVKAKPNADILGYGSPCRVLAQLIREIVPRGLPPKS